jgi:hypothetical protein
MPNQTNTPRDRHTAARRSPIPHGRTRRTRLVALALTVTVLTLTTLIGLSFLAAWWRSR